jgi:hypothetical protein
VARERAFWEREPTNLAVRRLAESSPLTIVVGAGSSVEAGLPTWIELIEALLQRVAVPELRSSRAITGEGPLSPEDQDCIDAFCSWTMEVEGLLGAAAVVRAALPDNELDTAIVEILYGNVGSKPPPGPTVKGLARIRALWGDECEIVTTNYDRLIETALVDLLGVPPDDVVSATDAEPRPGKIVVRHLHGVRTLDYGDGELIFAEGDYHRMQSGSEWQEEYFREKLAQTTCVFAGASMSDPNLLRYLYRAPAVSSDETRHIAVVVRQSDDWEFREDVAPEVRAAHAEAVRRRWKGAGVEPLQADYFVQSSQFLHEVALLRERQHIARYGQRLEAWETLIEDGILQTANRERFIRTQDQLSSLLRAWIRGVAFALGRSPEEEQLALQLWVRDPSDHALIFWAASDRSWREPGGLAIEPITRPTNRLAVEAFCSGNPIDVSLVDSSSRWNFLRAVPFFIENHDVWGRLPIGVLTISSTAPQDETMLYPADPDRWDAAQRYLLPLVEELLTP